MKSMNSKPISKVKTKKEEFMSPINQIQNIGNVNIEDQYFARVSMLNNYQNTNESALKNRLSGLFNTLDVSII